MGRSVRKRDIVMHIAAELGMKQTDVYQVIEKLFGEIINALAAGQKLELRNFGVFQTKIRKARVGRNPKTNQTVAIPERKKVTFKPGRMMKEKVK